MAANHRKTRRVTIKRVTYDSRRNHAIFEGINHPDIPWINKRLDIAKVQLLAEGTVGDPAEDPGFHEDYVDVRIWVCPKDAPLPPPGAKRGG